LVILNKQRITQSSSFLVPILFSSIKRAKTLFGFVSRAVLIVTLPGCAGYSFDINKNEVYTPPAFYTQYSIADSGLQSCIDQTIKDQKISSPLKVTTLQCSYNGISNLKGLSEFSRIERLSLKGNDIQEISELLQLTYLRYLDLSDNPTSDCRTIDQLEQLVIDTFIHNSECKTGDL